MEPEAGMGLLWVLLKPSGRAGLLAKLGLEAWISGPRMVGRCLGTLYSFKFLGTTT
jgi:hypothetical protein